MRPYGFQWIYFSEFSDKLEPVNTIEPLISMTEQGIACLPDLAVRRQLAEGALQT